MSSKMGTYEPCGIFSLEHFILIVCTISIIFIALKNTINKSRREIHKIIKISTIMMLILEIIKIIFNIIQNSFRAINTYIPLYYCSILLYAGLLSSFAKGKMKRVGDVSLATGSIIGGIVFIIYPSTSLTIYPIFHFLSIHSFLYHGTMIYLGLLINITKYIEIRRQDIKYFASLMGCMCVIAIIVNKAFNGNLMFISNNFPGTPIELIYNITKGGTLFTAIMSIIQITLPFYISYYIIKLVNYLKNKKILQLNNASIITIKQCAIEEKYNVKM